MKPRQPQLQLRLDAAPQEADAPWCAGGRVTHLGTSLTLILKTNCCLPERVGNELHLSLPPAATPRQIRDAAESWLREEAQRILAATVNQKSALAGRQAPRIILSFGKRGDWVKREGDILRCHWRLVEQTPAVIEQVLGAALAAHLPRPICTDLFALA